MQCPKDRKITLEESLLSGSLKATCCPECEGNWIPSETYKLWQLQQKAPTSAAELIPKLLDVAGFQASPLDAKAALCPECGSYLARTKVGMRAPFYVERCLSCGGVWCDRGEWAALEAMGLHWATELLFAAEWQALARDRGQLAQERQSTIDRLGEDLANEVFELSEKLAQHPHGDFGVAYLMRRFQNFAQAVDNEAASQRNQEVRDRAIQQL